MSDIPKGYVFPEACQIIEEFCASKHPRDIKLITQILRRIKGCQNSFSIRDFLSSLLFPIGISFAKHRPFLFYFRYKAQKYYASNLKQYTRNGSISSNNPGPHSFGSEPLTISEQEELDYFYMYNLAHNSSIAEQSLAMSPQPYEYTCEEVFCYDHSDCASIQGSRYELPGTTCGWGSALRIICSTLVSKKWRGTVKTEEQIPPCLNRILSQFPHFYLSTWHLPPIPTYSSSPSGGSPSRDENDCAGDDDPPRYNDCSTKDPSSSTSSMCLTPSSTDTERDYLYHGVTTKDGDPASEAPNGEPADQLGNDRRDFTLSSLANYTPDLAPILDTLCEKRIKSANLQTYVCLWKRDETFVELMAVIYSYCIVGITESVARITNMARAESHSEISNYFYGILCDETFLLSNLVAMMFREGPLSLQHSLYFGVLYVEPCECTIVDMSRNDFLKKYSTARARGSHPRRKKTKDDLINQQPISDTFVQMIRSNPSHPVTNITIDRLSDVLVTRRYPTKNGYIMRELFEHLQEISLRLLDMINSGNVFDTEKLPKTVKTLLGKVSITKSLQRLSLSSKQSYPPKWEPFKVRHYTIESLFHLLHRQGLFLELERLNLFMQEKIHKEHVWIEFQGKSPTRRELESTLEIISSQEKTIPTHAYIIIQSLGGRCHLVFRLCYLSVFRNVSLSCVYNNPKKLSKNIPLFPVHLMLTYTLPIYNRHPEEHLISLRCLVKSVLSGITTNSRSNSAEVMEVTDKLFPLYELLPKIISRWDSVERIHEAVLESYTIIAEEQDKPSLFGVLLAFIRVRSPRYLSKDSVLKIYDLLKKSPQIRKEFPDLSKYFTRLAGQAIFDQRAPQNAKYEMSLQRGCGEGLWSDAVDRKDRAHMPCVELYQLCSSILISHSKAREILFMIQPGSGPKYRMDSKGKNVQLALAGQLNDYIRSFGVEEDRETYLWSRQRYIRCLGQGNESHCSLMNFMQMIEWASLFSKTERSKLVNLLGPCHVDPFVLTRNPMELPVYIDEINFEVFYYNRTMFIAQGADQTTTSVTTAQLPMRETLSKTSAASHERTTRKHKPKNTGAASILSEKTDHNESFMSFLFHHGSYVYHSLHAQDSEQKSSSEGKSIRRNFYDSLQSCTRAYETDQQRAQYLGCKFKYADHSDDCNSPPKRHKIT